MIYYRKVNICLGIDSYISVCYDVDGDIKAKFFGSTEQAASRLIDIWIAEHRVNSNEEPD